MHEMEQYDLAPETQKILSLAREETVRLGHPEVLIGHVVIAMTHAESAAQHLLQELAPLHKLSILREAVLFVLPEGVPVQALRPLPISRHLHDALHRGRAFADANDSHFMLPVHALYGLVGHRSGPVGFMFKTMGITPRTVRDALLDAQAVA